jgi:hypothetical protein
LLPDVVAAREGPVRHLRVLTCGLLKAYSRLGVADAPREVVIFRGGVAMQLQLLRGADVDPSEVAAFVDSARPEVCEAALRLLVGADEEVVLLDSFRACEDARAPVRVLALAAIGSSAC